MTLIYRVETDNGIGPYVSFFTAWLQAAVVCGEPEEDLHPSPEHSGLGFTKHGERFGFDTLEDVFQWFYAEPIIRALEEDGYGVSVYEVPEHSIARGIRQLKFVLDDAERVSFQPITGLYFERQTFTVDNTEHDE